MDLRRADRTRRIGAIVALTLLLTGCTATSSDTPGPSHGVGAAPDGAHGGSRGDQLSHVHGLDVNPRDGHLYVATHHGVFRLADAGAVRVGDGRQDTMGFTVTGPDEFLASGHPAPDEDGPAHLGLIGSTDAGRTWKSLSLAGQADFHLLRESGGVLYGVDSTRGALMASTDRINWQRRAGIEAYDLAVDPARPQTLLATTEQGIRRSTDGGRTWSPTGGPTLLLLHWSARELLGVATDGQLLRSTDGATTWTPTGGRVPATPAAVTAHDGLLYLATRDARVLRSADAGATWQPMAS